MKTKSKKNELILIKEFLDEKADKYNNSSFIENDPICIPHRYNTKQDIEISAFFAASISWGNRSSIIKSADKLMRIMGNNPLDYVMNANNNELNKLNNFVHRTFNSIDAKQFILSLKKIYQHHQSMETAFAHGNNMYDRLIIFNKIFTDEFRFNRSTKHVSNPEKGSAAKRLNMFLRWMVRKDNKGVDFGIWNSIRPSELYLPLDVHTGNIARKLGLLRRKQNDWKALEDVMHILRMFDKDDPVKYDFALFGLGAIEKF